MDIVLLLIIALFVLLTMLTIFSLIMILTALNQNKPKIKKAKKAKKEKKVKKRKERRKTRQSAIIDTDEDMPEQYIISNPSNDIPTSQDTNSSISEMDMPEEDVIDFCEIPEFSMNPMDEPVQPENKLTKFMHGLKQRVTQAQTDAQARAIQREEMRIQEEFELADMGETLEEAPEDFSGKLKYWWRNNFAFRIGICITAVLLVCIMIFYSFQVRSKSPLDVAQNVTIEKEKDADNKTDEKETKQDMEQDDDLIMAEFRKKLGDELAPIDVKADSLEPLPNMAEIVETVQQNTGRTTATYPGSNTTQQPAGSIATISIPSINLKNAPVMGSVELSDLAKGTGHFENTPVFDGNVGIAGHNNTHFKYLANVEIGNQIQYTVNGVTRTYEVTDMRAISDNDWGVFTDHGDNRLTLITCEHAVPDRRIAVTAVQVGADQGTATATHQRPSTTRNNVKSNSTQHQDSGDYHDAGGGYTDYIGTFTGVN